MQHLSPRYVSSLPEILARNASLPVLVMQDGQLISPGVIYTAPPGVEVRVRQGVLRLRLARQQLARATSRKVRPTPPRGREALRRGSHSRSSEPVASNLRSQPI